MTRWEHCKITKTYAKDKSENGSVVELFKDKSKTCVYITVIKPGAFKGYHVHSRRINQFVCIRGEVFVHYKEPLSKLKTIVLDSNILERFIIMPNIPIAIENTSKKDAWLLNYPNPAYDPMDKGEQVFMERGEVE